MAEVDGNPQAEAAAPVVDSPEAVVGSAPTVEGRWKLPEGIEDHIESGTLIEISSQLTAYKVQRVQSNQSEFDFAL